MGGRHQADLGLLLVRWPEVGRHSDLRRGQCTHLGGGQGGDVLGDDRGNLRGAQSGQYGSRNARDLSCCQQADLAVDKLVPSALTCAYFQGTTWLVVDLVTWESVVAAAWWSSVLQYQPFPHCLDLSGAQGSQGRGRDPRTTCAVVSAAMSWLNRLELSGGQAIDQGGGGVRCLSGGQRASLS